MRRPPRLLLAVQVLAALGLAGCAPFHAGAAATVGDARISTDQLRTLTTTVLGAQPQDGTTNDAAEATVQRAALGELVQLRVLSSMAAARGTTVGDAQVGAARTSLVGQIAQSVYQGQVPAGLSAVQVQVRAVAVAAAAGIDLTSLARVNAYVTALTTSQAVPDAKVTAAFESVADHRFYDIDAIQVADQTTAQAVAASLQSDPTSFDRIASTLGAGATTRTTVAAATLQQQAGSAALKVGSVVGPGQISSGAYQIVLVTGQGVRTLSDALAPGSTERTALQAQEFPIAYAAAAAALGIHVNPRFGAWSPAGQDPLGERVGLVAVGGEQLSVPLVGASPTPSPSAAATGP